MNSKACLPRLLALLCAALLGVAAPCFAEAKAEPLRVPLKNGSAALRGTVRGDEQFEYAVAARKGQRLTIEVTSQPHRAAALRIQAPTGHTSRARFVWSSTLAHSGEYLIFVSKPSGISSARFTLSVKLSPRPAATKASRVR